MVVISDAVPHPRAVVVHSHHALLANFAMVRARRFDILALFAPFKIGLSELELSFLRPIFKFWISGLDRVFFLQGVQIHILLFSRFSQFRFLHIIIAFRNRRQLLDLIIHSHIIRLPGFDLIDNTLMRYFLFNYFICLRLARRCSLDSSYDTDTKTNSSSISRRTAVCTDKSKRKLGSTRLENGNLHDCARLVAW